MTLIKLPSGRLVNVDHVTQVVPQGDAKWSMYSGSGGLTEMDAADSAALMRYLDEKAEVRS